MRFSLKPVYNYSSTSISFHIITINRQNFFSLLKVSMWKSTSKWQKIGWFLSKCELYACEFFGIFAFFVHLENYPFQQIGVITNAIVLLFFDPKPHYNYGSVIPRYIHDWVVRNTRSHGRFTLHRYTIIINQSCYKISLYWHLNHTTIVVLSI